MPISRSFFVVALTIVSFVSGAPSRIQDNNGYMQAVYDAIGEPEYQNYNPLMDGDLMRLERTSLDSLSGATFGQSKKYDPNIWFNGRRLHYKPAEKNRIFTGYLPKRNFDEIDRTNFDSFVKKNHIKIPQQALKSAENLETLNQGFDLYHQMVNSL